MCLWTILAALVLAIFAIVTITHIAKQKERDKEFSKAMEEKYGIVMTERR